jgi:peroxiredoxin
MSLQVTLDAFCASFKRRVGNSVSCFEEDIVHKISSNLDEAKTARPGMAFPQNTPLLDADSRTFDLSSHATGKPLVVKIYRGGWCPYCRIDLRAFEAAYATIRENGAELVAISPELPRHLAKTREDNDLTYPVLSDQAGVLTKQLGLHLTLSQEMIDFMRSPGFDLRDWHGTSDWFMAAPATFVLSGERIIAEAFTSPDYRKRVEPSKIIALL